MTDSEYLLKDLLDTREELEDKLLDEVLFMTMEEYNQLMGSYTCVCDILDKYHKFMYGGVTND